MPGMDTLARIRDYLNLRQKIHEDLKEINAAGTNSLPLSSLLELVKDSSFEPIAFEMLLKINSKAAQDHLKSYYLDDNPNEIARFKANLDVMLDDYREILGEASYNTLISSLSEEAKKHPSIKWAIDFANDH